MDKMIRDRHGNVVARLVKHSDGDYSVYNNQGNAKCRLETRADGSTDVVDNYGTVIQRITD